MPVTRTDPGFQEYLRKMKIAISTAESGNQNIRTKAPGQSATGFYQFNKSHLDSMKAFAKQVGVKIDTIEDFEKNEAFQHAYFEHDLLKGYNFALQNADNKLGYNLEQLGYLRHFKGDTGAKNDLKAGKVFDVTKNAKGQTINPKSDKVMKKFTEVLQNEGLYEDPQYAKNIARAGSVPVEQRKKVQDEYFKKLDKIENQDLEPLTKQTLIKQLNQEYFDQGNLGMVNQKINYRNNHKLDRFKDLKSKQIGGKQGARMVELEMKELASKNASALDTIGAGGRNIFTQKEKDELEKLRSSATDNLSPREKEELKTLQTEFISRNYAEDPTFTKRFSKDPQISLRDYVRPMEAGTALNEEGEVIKTDASGDKKPEASAVIADAVKPASPALESVMTENEFLASLDEPYMDPKFKYVPGGFNMPAEAFIGLYAGIQGMKAAKEKPVMRDEEIQEGLLNYAADNQRIAKMGLAPEVEASLKQDLASMYQTGLNNIARASAGNRNLVLGNQGQLDQARMSGMTQIALMDMDARQKGMDAYGRVMEYFNNFQMTKDVANNERMYAEFQKRQTAGIAVAEKGFGMLIDSLKTARDTGPNSPYDMYYQKMKYNITGVNDRLPDDGSGTVPGTQSYADKIVENQKSKRDDSQRKKDYFYNQVPEDKREDFLRIYQKNPYKPADELIAEFSGVYEMPKTIEEIDKKSGFMTSAPMPMLRSNTDGTSYENENYDPFDPIDKEREAKLKIQNAESMRLNELGSRPAPTAPAPAPMPAVSPSLLPPTSTPLMTQEEMDQVTANTKKSEELAKTITPIIDMTQSIRDQQLLEEKRLEDTINNTNTALGNLIR